MIRVIIQKPKDLQWVVEGDIIRGTQVILRDNTGTIRLINNTNPDNFCCLGPQDQEQVLSKLSIGDKIRVLGARLDEDSYGKALSLSPYGSIIKIGTEYVANS